MSIPACQLNCLNGGYCNYISSDESTLIETFGKGGLIQICVCPPEYGGLSCERKKEQCSDDLKCHNGVPCALDEETGEHYCDCSYGDLISPFAGKMCREPATSYCGQGDIKNRSFCTNGGLCESNIYRGVHFDQSNEYSTHKGCACPPEFEGDHCEFLKDVPLDASESEHETKEEVSKAQISEDDEEEMKNETLFDESVLTTEVLPTEESPLEEESTQQISKEDKEEESKTSAENIAPSAEVLPTEESPLEEEVTEQIIKEDKEEENTTPAEDIAPSAEVLPTEIEAAPPLNHSKESDESSPLVTKEKVEEAADQSVELIHDKTSTVHDEPPPKASPVPEMSSVDLESAHKTPAHDNPIIDLESKPEVPAISAPLNGQSNKELSSEPNHLRGSIIALMSLTGVALIVGLLAHRRKRKRKNRNVEDYFIQRSHYRDETPIRIQTLSELERPNELDEVLGLDAGRVEYEDDDDMMTERSECSLEEIELDQQTNVGYEEDEYDQPNQRDDSNPFAHIIGPLMRSGNDGIV